MAKTLDNAVLDAACTKIATCTKLTVCSSQPANFAGIAAVKLAEVTMTAGDGNGDYVIANDTTGRKVTMQAQTALSITASGTATYIVLDDGTTLLLATTCTSQALTSGGTVDVPAFKAGFAAPT